jgi:serine/threonine protein kinase
LSITLSTKKYNKEFILKGKLGKGSFGKVYKVESKSDKQSYAVKKIAVQGIYILFNVQKLILFLDLPQKN